MEWLEKLFASEQAQQLLVNILIGIGGWIALKFSAIIESQKAQLKAAEAAAKEQDEEIKFAKTKEKFLELLGMGVLSAEQTYKKEIKAKYEEDHKIDGADAEFIWKNVFTDAWGQMVVKDQKLLEAFIGDIKGFAKTAIHANLTKIKALPSKK